MLIRKILAVILAILIFAEGIYLAYLLDRLHTLEQQRQVSK